MAKDYISHEQWEVLQRIAERRPRKATLDVLLRLGLIAEGLAPGSRPVHLTHYGRVYLSDERYWDKVEQAAKNHAFIHRAQDPDLAKKYRDFGGLLLPIAGSFGKDK